MYKFQKTYPFYAENGITATSANYIANLGKERYRTILKELEDIVFYSTEASIPGTEGSFVISRSIDPDTFARIPELLGKIYSVKALIAWLREAIKTRQEMFDELNNLSFDDYVKLNHLPTLGDLSKEYDWRLYHGHPDHVIDSWDIDDLWERMYGEELKTVVENAFRSFNTAMRTYERFDGETTTLKEVAKSGRKINGIVCTDVTASRSDLEAAQRTLKQSFIYSSEAIAPLMRREADEESAYKEIGNKTIKSLELKIEATRDEIQKQQAIFIRNEKKRVSALRIRIPEVLQPIYDELNS